MARTLGRFRPSRNFDYQVIYSDDLVVIISVAHRGVAIGHMAWDRPRKTWTTTTPDLSRGRWGMASWPVLVMLMLRKFHEREKNIWLTDAN